MDWAKRRKRVRAVFAAGHYVYPGSVFDLISPVSPQLSSRKSSMFAHCLVQLLGAPDILILGPSEFAEQAYRINGAGTLVLLVGSDHGYGTGLSVKRTVEGLESTGVAGLSSRTRCCGRRMAVPRADTPAAAIERVAWPELWSPEILHAGLAGG